MAANIKVKLLLLDEDAAYRERLVYALTNLHAGEFELFVFSDWEQAIDCAQKRRIDVFLASEHFEIDTDKIPGYCSFAYLVDSAAIATYKNESAIGKYQKLSGICNEIRLLHANHLADFEMKSAGSSRIFLFSSPAGGVGTTTMAVAYASYLVKSGMKVLYLNLEQTGDTSLYFDKKGFNDLETVVYELLANNPDKEDKKNREDGKVNKEQKILGLVEQSDLGIDFIPSPENAAVFNDIQEEVMERLIKIYGTKGKYNAVVVDMPFLSYQFMTKLASQADRLFLFSDGSVEANRKTERALTAMSVIDSTVIDNLTLAYNRNSSQRSKEVNFPGLHQIGGVGRIEGAEPRQLTAEISSREIMNNM